MLNLLRKSLSLEIENFIGRFKPGNTAKFTKSVFQQAGKKIKPEVFEQLSDLLLNEFYTDPDRAIKLWKGFRVLAIAGSRITWPITKELKAIYGESKNQSHTVLVQARCSVIYDVLNNYVLDGFLVALINGERDLALNHLEHCKENDLVIYDRGYPCNDLIYQHIEKGFDYFRRAKTSFNKVTIDF